MLACYPYSDISSTAIAIADIGRNIDTYYCISKDG
nr:MAG TPA: hypothetical protein [Caudoviricetes sp.]